MSRTPGILFGFLAVVLLAVIVWARSGDDSGVATESGAVPDPVEIAAAPATVAEPAPPAPTGTPAATVPAPAAPVGVALAPAEPDAIAVAAVARGPSLGVPATAEQLAQLNISIPPDGRNLPPGRGNSAEGAAVFTERCARCHGSRGAGGEGLVTLTGGLRTLDTERPVKTVSSFWPYATTLFDYIRRAMPLDAPQSLTDDEVYAVVAYLLSVDDIIPIGTVMDQTTLPLVEMPNRDGFVNWWPGPPLAATNPG